MYDVIDRWVGGSGWVSCLHLDMSGTALGLIMLYRLCLLDLSLCHHVYCHRLARLDPISADTLGCNLAGAEGTAEARDEGGILLEIYMTFHAV